jgi:hypothetical protein
MNINETLDRIKNSIYGRDIRQAIVDSITTAYNDASKTGNANMEVALARGFYTTLTDRLKALDTNLGNIGNASPKGVYATVASLQTALPNGANGIYLVTGDGNWYFWSGSAWTVGGAYQAVTLADGSVGFKQLYGAVQGKNLFDKSKVTAGNFVSSSSGALQVNSVYNASDYIPVKPGTAYTITQTRALAFYDASKTYISGIDNTNNAQLTFTTPANAAYVRVSFVATATDTIQVELGSTATAYEQYGYFSIPLLKPSMQPASVGQNEITKGGVGSTNIANNSVLSVHIADSQISARHISGANPGKNLYNKDTRTIGFYISSVDGSRMASSAYDSSDYISIKPNTAYAFNGFRMMAWYDANKVFISGLDSGVAGNLTTATSPANAAYARCSVGVSWNPFQFEEGSAPTSYVPYGITWTSLIPTIAPQSVGSAEIKAGGVGETNIAVGSVNNSHLKNAVQGKNLFNKDTVIMNSFIGFDSGTVVTPHASYTSSDWIPVTENTQYAFYGVMTQHYAFYDANKKRIGPATNGGGNDSGGIFITTMPGTAFMRVTTDQAALGYAQIEKGTARTAWEKYGYSLSYLNIKEGQLTSESVGSDAIKKLAILPKHLSDYTSGKNLFDKDAVTLNKYVSFQGGGLADNPAYVASDWIPVDPNTAYICNQQMRMYALYDANKIFISGQEYMNGFTTPANGAYARITAAAGTYPSVQFEKGTAPSSFEAYGYKLTKMIPPTTLTDTFKLFLPDEICIAVGRGIDIYNSQVSWCGNIANYHFQWTCDIGRAMKRKWTCSPVAAQVGTSHTLTCTVYDNNMNQVATAATTVKIVASTVVNAKKILPIGDSLTNGKPWLAEVINLSGNKYSYVGTRWTGDVQGGTRNHEGRSGATAGWYLANSSYTYETNGVSSGNPFWNPNTSKFDFAYYKSTYNIVPDAVQLFLGTNGISLDPSGNVNSIKAIIDGIRATDATIPIFVVNTLFRGDQNGIGNQLSSDGYSAGSGVWKTQEDAKVYNLQVALKEALKSYSNVYFIPVAITHDSENNFKSNTATAVNPRSTIMEVVDAEATHPSPRPDGYYQMADIMFSTFAAKLG